MGWSRIEFSRLTIRGVEDEDPISDDVSWIQTVLKVQLMWMLKEALDAYFSPVPLTDPYKKDLLRKGCRDLPTAEFAKTLFMRGASFREGYMEQYLRDNITLLKFLPGAIPRDLPINSQHGHAISSNSQLSQAISRVALEVFEMDSDTRSPALLSPAVRSRRLSEHYCQTFIFRSSGDRGRSFQDEGLFLRSFGDRGRSFFGALFSDLPETEADLFKMEAFVLDLLEIEADLSEADLSKMEAFLLNLLEIEADLSKLEAFFSDYFSGYFDIGAKIRAVLSEIKANLSKTGAFFSGIWEREATIRATLSEMEAFSSDLYSDHLEIVADLSKMKACQAIFRALSIISRNS